VLIDFIDIPESEAIIPGKLHIIYKMSLFMYQGRSSEFFHKHSVHIYSAV